MLFNMGFYRKEVFADELGSLLIFIRLGIQPSAGSSRRSRAEIQQDGAGLLLGCGEGLIDILAPIHAHGSAPCMYGATTQNCSLSASWIERGPPIWYKGLSPPFAPHEIRPSADTCKLLCKGRENFGSMNSSSFATRVSIKIRLQCLANIGATRETKLQIRSDVFGTANVIPCCCE